MELSKSITLLSCLAHETRLIIFKQLVQAGTQGLTPKQLVEELEIPAATLSFHLKELYQAGLTHRVKLGRSINYSANYDNMSSLINYLQDNCCAQNPCNCC